MRLKLGSRLEIWQVERTPSKWYVRNASMLTISHFEQVPAGILIRGVTDSGHEHECIRPSNPSMEELFASPWRQVKGFSDVVYHLHLKSVWVEAIQVFNCHRAESARSRGELNLRGLIFADSSRGDAYPSGDVARCKWHDRFSFKSGQCPLCIEETDQREEKLLLMDLGLAIK
jgi:hypothetical protein